MHVLYSQLALPLTTPTLEQLIMSESCVIMICVIKLCNVLMMCNIFRVTGELYDDY